MGIKISELPSTTTPTEDDLIPVLDRSDSILKSASLKNAIAAAGTVGKEITQAEYDALTPQEQAEGQYFIKDAPGAGAILVDAELDTTSTHAIQNKPVATAINQINQNLTEKIEQKSGSLSDGTDTYTGINLDFISYDATAKKLLLHEKGTGADAVIPFSGGSLDSTVIMEDYEFKEGFALGALVAWRVNTGTTRNFALVDGKLQGTVPGNTSISTGNVFGSLSLPQYSKIVLTYEVNGVEDSLELDLPSTNGSKIGIVFTYGQLSFGVVDESTSPYTIRSTIPTPVIRTGLETVNAVVAIKSIVAYKRPSTGHYPYIGFIAVTGTKVEVVDFESLSLTVGSQVTTNCTYGTLTWSSSTGWSLTPSATITGKRYNTVDGWTTCTLQSGTSYNIYNGANGDTILLESFE